MGSQYVRYGKNGRADTGNGRTLRVAINYSNRQPTRNDKSERNSAYRLWQTARY